MAVKLEPEQAEAALQEVLTAPPFAGETLSAGNTLLRLWRLLVDWYNRTMGDLYVDHPLSFWGVMVVLSIVLMLLVWHITVALRDVWRTVRHSGVVESAPVAGHTELTLNVARQAIAGENYRLAVELAFAVAVAGIAAISGVRLTQARTAREQVRRLHDVLPANRRAAMQQLLASHERACYAPGAVARGDAELAVAKAQRALEQS